MREIKKEINREREMIITMDEREKIVKNEKTKKVRKQERKWKAEWE